MHPRGDLLRAFADAPQGQEIIQRLRERIEMEGRMKLKIRRLDKSIPPPEYATDGASGLDLRSAVTTTIPPGGRAKLPTGLCLEIPLGLEGQVRPRSGLTSRGILGAFGTIDADYRGEVAVILENRSSEAHMVHAGDRVAQLVIAPVVRVQVEEAEELSETERGDGGFGSTGVA